MCFLCVISRWSRRIASMLPWLVIPFIIVWALSQLLPPSYRLEVTSSRLACLGVLLMSLLWYELLMPWLSSWRAHRSALLRERRLIEALEAAKWRKEATRRCRNCLTAYKVQMPGSGRYVCTYCGHISKRPVLEVAGALASSKLVASGPLLGNHGAGMLHFKGACQGNGPLAAWSRAAERNRCAWFGEGLHTVDKCNVEQSFPAPLLFISRMMALVWRKLLGLAHSTTDGSRDLHRASENIDDSTRDRDEKARRKADKKRQARLQKELLEAEERKQREEVALLVEERRRQRDELEVMKQKEREADAEKEKERRARDNEKRVEKASKRVLQQANGTLDQGQQHVVGAMRKAAGEAAVPMGISKEQVAESTTTAKLSRGTDASRYRSTMDSFSRLGFLKRAGTRPQRAPGSASKLGITSQGDGLSRGKKDGAQMVGKSTISTGIPGSSPMATPHVPESAWKRTPWLSAWVKGSKGVWGDSTRPQMESITDSGKRLEKNLDGGLKSSNNYTCINKPSVSPVRGTAIQPPIAPPSVHVDPLQQLFSTPSLFSPLDLQVNVNNHFEQKSHSETKGVFLPEHTFFEAHTYSQSISSFALPFASPPLQMPMPVLDTISTPSQPTLEGSESSFVQSNAAIPQCSVLFDTLYDGERALAVGSPNEAPLNSPRTSDSVVKDTLIPSALLGSLKINDLDAYTDKEDFLPWNGAEEEVLHLPPLSTVQSLFDSEALTHDTCLQSLQKMGNPKVTEDISINGMQGLDERTFTSAFDTAARIWDDADGSQKVPAEFVDCITQEIMEDPVITADGHSYERAAIEKWLKHHDTSPKTGEVLPPPPGSSGVDKTLRPNHILRGQIIEYKERLARM
eukprot:c25129_g1_i1 orf=654-3227(+)